jgi:hypothetical protein
MAASARRALWTCPRCRHRFVTRNVWHSCSNYSLADHFRGRPPELRHIFDRYLAAVRRCGPVTVVPQKTRIVFMVRVRFAGAVVRNGWIEAAMWLTRRAASPRVHRIETVAPNCHIPLFRLTTPADVDDELRSLLREAYSIGRQEHLDSAPRPGRS